jgi:hypothetical protein
VQKERESLSLGQLAVIDFLVLARAQVSILPHGSWASLFDDSLYSIFAASTAAQPAYQHRLVAFIQCIRVQSFSLRPGCQNEQRLNACETNQGRCWVAVAPPSFASRTGHPNSSTMCCLQRLVVFDRSSFSIFLHEFRKLHHLPGQPAICVFGSAPCSQYNITVSHVQSSL